MNHEWHHLFLPVLFQAHGVLCQPVIFDLLHTSPELFQFPFGAAKGLIEELWVMLPAPQGVQIAGVARTLLPNLPFPKKF